MKTDPMIFVVEAEHVILYAGTEVAKVRNVVCDSDLIEVWQGGLWLGSITFDGMWLFKTDNYDADKARELMEQWK